MVIFPELDMSRSGYSKLSTTDDDEMGAPAQKADASAAASASGGGAGGVVAPRLKPGEAPANTSASGAAAGANPAASGAQAPQLAQIACSGCTTVLAYPPGAYSVQCPKCDALTACRQMATVVCPSCRQVLLYPVGASGVACPCSTVIRVLQPHEARAAGMHVPASSGAPPTVSEAKDGGGAASGSGAPGGPGVELSTLGSGGGTPVPRDEAAERARAENEWASVPERTLAEAGGRGGRVGRK